MTIKLIISVILSIILIIFIAAGNYFYNFSILRQKKEFLSKDPDLKETTSGANWNSNKEWLQHALREDWVVESRDNLKLYAMFLPCPTPSDKTVILVHGYNSWSGSMGDFAQYYIEHLGYNVLIPDLRGHGNSEGSYIGFGWPDRNDMLLWIDMLRKKNPNISIALHGVSMGGSTVLMTSGEKLPDNIKCCISDCSYDSIEGILGYQLKRMFKLPKFPLVYFTSLICRLRAGYSFINASALKQVQRSKIPTLFIHGSADKFVPASMVYELYQAASCDKQLLIIQDAAHGTSFWKDPEKYKRILEEFLRRYNI